MTKGQVTGCSALASWQPPELGPLGPVICGWPAVAPHPDPEKSYREPLCSRHLSEATALMNEGTE